MPVTIKPIKAKLTNAGNLESLAEFDDGDVVSVSDGGTGVTSLDSGKVILGNGTGALTTLSRGNLISGSSKIIINGGSSATGVVLGSNVTIDLVESEIDINKTTGQIPLSRVLQQEPGTIDAEFSDGRLLTTDVPDENGDMVYDGSTF